MALIKVAVTPHDVSSTHCVRNTNIASDSPDEVFAVAAEGGLLEEPGDEAVVVDLRDVFLLERAHPLAGLARLVLVLAAVAAIVDRLPRHRRSGQGHFCRLV